MSQHTEALNKALTALMLSLEEVDSLMSDIIRSGDVRDVNETLRLDYISGVNVIRKELDEKSLRLLTKYDTMLATNYLKDLESIRGKGTWREEIANERYLVKCVGPLRQHLPEVSLREAKLIVEAHKAGAMEPEVPENFEGSSVYVDNALMGLQLRINTAKHIPHLAAILDCSSFKAKHQTLVTLTDSYLLDPTAEKGVEIQKICTELKQLLCS